MSRKKLAIMVARRARVLQRWVETALDFACSIPEQQVHHTSAVWSIRWWCQTAGTSAFEAVLSLTANINSFIRIPSLIDCLTVSKSSSLDRSTPQSEEAEQRCTYGRGIGQSDR
jgi:hypothetical protein